MSEQLIHLTLTEIGRRINAHLQRAEAAERKRLAAERKESGSQDNSLQARYFNAGAGQIGAYVGVHYISYQGGSNLTRAEALHYLRALDAGFAGRHHELFRKDPPPAAPEAEVRFTSLVRDRFGYFLYDVTRRTEKRVYGRKVGSNSGPDYVDRSAVLKVQATEDDLRAVLEAKAEMQRKQAEAAAEFRRELARICGKDQD